MHDPMTKPMMIRSRCRRRLMRRITLLRPGTRLAVSDIRAAMPLSVVRCDARSARVAYAWLPVHAHTKEVSNLVYSGAWSPSNAL